MRFLLTPTTTTSDPSKFWGGVDRVLFEQDDNYIAPITPEYRSSTVFPIFFDLTTSTELNFLSYWSIKHRSSVAIVMTLRHANGHVHSSKRLFLDVPRAVSIKISEVFDVSQDTLVGFLYSLEVEVFSEAKPYFTFPALQISYISKRGVSMVHSCCRSYNISEKVNDYALTAPQTGFDIQIGKGKRNFIAFIGAEAPSYEIKLTLEIGGNFLTNISISVVQTRAKMLHVITLEDYITVDETLFGRGRVLINHDCEDIFPRFYCGIMEPGGAPSLTHSFFDTSDRTLLELGISKENAKVDNPDPEKFVDSAFAIPILPLIEYNTVLMSYNCNSSFEGNVEICIRNLEGLCLHREVHPTTPGEMLQGYGELDLSLISESNGLPNDCILVAELRFITQDGSTSHRLKLGLNVSRKFTEAIGTNICFAPNTISKQILTKPFNRRWGPIGGPNNLIFFLHSTPLDRLPSEIEHHVEILVFNKFGERLKRELNLHTNKSLFIDASSDNELKQFLLQEIGWVYITIDSSLCDAFFISTIGDQLGGDHAF